MTRLLYLLIVVCALLPACSFLNDFDGYEFESEAGPEKPDQARKPGRGDAGAADAETEPETAQDGTTTAIDAGADASDVGPSDAAQGAPEAGSAGDASTPLDAAPPVGLEGTWDVQLRLTSETCPGSALLDADTWELTRARAVGVAQLVSSAWTLEGPLTLEGGRAVAATFSGLVPGAAGASTRWELDVHLEGALLAGEMQQTSVRADGGIGCSVRREIKGTR